MSNEEEKKPWDVKQLGIGGGTVLGILFLFQSQGIEFINKQQDAQTSVVIEKTVANAARIERLEEQFTDLKKQMREDFKSMQDLIRSENEKLGELMRLYSDDRFTKSEHSTYEKQTNQRLRSIEDRMNMLAEDVKEIKSK